MYHIAVMLIVKEKWRDAYGLKTRTSRQNTLVLQLYKLLMLHDSNSPLS